MGVHNTMKLLLVILWLGIVRCTEFPREREKGICDFRNEPFQSPGHFQRGINSKDVRNNLPTPELIRSAGYPAETHYTTTEDGYILALHRIPHGKTGVDDEDDTVHDDDDTVDDDDDTVDDDDDTHRPVIFVQHGILASSADWVLSTPTKGLGFILADAGYDVWLGNYRGSTYSRNHTFLDPDNQREGFWDFTWDEMAHYDLPAMIEKVLELTGESELFYAGHSMGTTAFMAMHHYRPDIGEKIRLANFLAPVASESDMGGPLGWIAGFMGGIFDWVLEDLLT